ncbi:hypothetical protein [Enterobacter kobei]|uniref:hypothetical protein n=1 Tax=Enterobacter kobei TaxID=208224 RepID=UPI002025FA9C|nr:hypothetical protein [Enterobacter kobei]
MKKLASVIALAASVGFFASAHAGQNCTAKSAALKKKFELLNSLVTPIKPLI